MESIEQNQGLNLDEATSDNTVAMFEAGKLKISTIGTNESENLRWIIKKGRVVCIFLFKSKIPSIVIGPHCE